MSFPPIEHVTGAQGAERAWLKKTGRRAWSSVSLGQVYIESADLKAQSGVNNFGGIKANKDEIAAGKFRKCWTREVIGGKSVRILAPFASYDTLEAFYAAHARVVLTIRLYAAAWTAKTADEFLARIAVHYATDPDYTRVVRGVMQHYDLYQYDLPPHEVPAPVAKPPVIPEKHHQTVAAGAGGAVVVAAAEGGKAAFPHLGGIPWPAIGAFALVAAIGALWWYLSRRAHEAKVAAILATPAMSIDEAHAYMESMARPVPAPTPALAPPVEAPAPAPTVIAPSVAALPPEPRPVAPETPPAA